MTLRQVRRIYAQIYVVLLWASMATLSRALRRHCLALSDSRTTEAAPVRYERPAAVSWHLDIKKLSRSA